MCLSKTIHACFNSSLSRSTQNHMCQIFQFLDLMCRLMFHIGRLMNIIFHIFSSLFQYGSTHTSYRSAHENNFQNFSSSFQYVSTHVSYRSAHENNFQNFSKLFQYVSTHDLYRSLPTGRLIIHFWIISLHFSFSPHTCIVFVGLFCLSLTMLLLV